MRKPFTVQREPYTGDKTSFTGALLPKELVEQLSLVATYQGISKSVVIRSALERYVKDFDERGMVKILADRAVVEWENRKRENVGKALWNQDEAFGAFLVEIQTELEIRGVPDRIVRKIAKRVKP